MGRVRTSVTEHQPPASSPIPADGTLAPDCVALALIHALIPLGLRAVEEALQQEVVALAGARYARGSGAPGLARWGTPRGSVYLADQMVPVSVPRARRMPDSLRAFSGACRAASITRRPKPFRVVALGVTTTGEKRILGLV